MLRRWIALFVFIICVIDSLAHECNLDSDCSMGKACRMVCKRTCSAICVTLPDVKLGSLKTPKSSSEEPFAVEANPFDFLQRDEVVTPLTISEAELEAELKASSLTTVSSPPELPVTIELPTPPSFIPDVPGFTTLAPEASSPSQEPQPPGLEQHESGYMPPTSIENSTTTMVIESITTPLSIITELPSTTASVISGGYDKDSAAADSHNAESFNHIEETTHEAATLPVSEATFFSDGTTTTPPLGTTEVVNAITDSLESNDLQATGVPGIPFEEHIEGCPAPQICGKNCGVYINEKGCQTCQCLWLPIPCEDSSDCVEEGQFCDLGRCECMPGYVQDMLQSGICKALPDSTGLQSIAEIHSNSTSMSNDPAVAEVRSNSTSAINTPNYPLRRYRRSQSPEKPQRMERLQWPGPCDRDSQCPASLYCIEGDCWHLPEKPLRGLPHQKNEIPKSFPVRTEEEELATITPLPDNQPLFDFKAFPKPPPTTASNIGVEDDYEDAKPPSLRPLDYDETSFLGEFGATFDVKSPHTTTTEKPVTRLIVEEPLFIKKSKRKPNLQEILTTPSKQSLRSIRMEDLPPPKYRNPQVAAEGWQPMHPHRASTPFRLPTTTPMDEMTKVHLDYSSRMRRPVRVEMTGARHVIRDECTNDRQCGESYICCEKEWIDLSREYGKAKFCLPNCEVTKMTHLSSTGIRGMPLIDLVYD